MSRCEGSYYNYESPAANAQYAGPAHCDDFDDQGEMVDNSATVLAKIATAYADRLLSDITLVVGNQSFAAHRLILCASSDVFQVMLMNPSRWNESRETKVILQEVPACAAVFGNFLEYLYTGKMNIGCRNVLPHLMLADKYNVKDLVPLCLKYISRSVSVAADHHQLISWLQYLSHSGHSAAAEACNSFVRWNFEKVSSAEDFANLDADTLEEILRSSDLVVRDELAVFRAVCCWLGSRDLRPDAVDDSAAMMVLEQIRFAMMTPRHLATLLLSPLTIRYKDFFMARMAAAMTFHSGSSAATQEWLGIPGWLTPEGVAASETFHDGTVIKPRLYTTETWCAKLGIDNYRDFPEHGVRTLMFSIPEGLADPNMQRPLEWSVDLYPKGVMFPKCSLIRGSGILEVSETWFRTVRLSVMLRTKDVPVVRVRVAALITGVVNDVEYVMAVAQKRFVFTPSEAMVNINDVVPYDELNLPGSAFLVGEDRNSLEVHVIITPDME